MSLEAVAVMTTEGCVYFKLCVLYSCKVICCAPLLPNSCHVCIYCDFCVHKSLGTLLSLGCKVWQCVPVIPALRTEARGFKLKLALWKGGAGSKILLIYIPAEL